jgi:acyl-coenzyme A synthetase/AMP-(fatty) acid ligase/acyl carrier protein
MVNRLYWMKEKYRFDENDVSIQKTAVTFDVSVCELLRWIPGGGKLILLSREEERNPELIINAVEKSKVTIIDFVPSMLNLFLDCIDTRDKLKRLSSLRLIFVGAEVLSPVLMKKFNDKWGEGCNVTLINAYGPTETTVDITNFDCSISESFDIVPIGKPMSNTRLYIVDKWDNLQPIGVPGELVVSGESLARGYMNSPELTGEKFVISHQSLVNDNSTNDRYTNDQCPMTNDRLYRTGDLARWLPDGNIEFLGRGDYQVKIRGYRVELGEIENWMLKHPYIDEAAVNAYKNKAGDHYLCSWFVSTETLTVGQLREFLRVQLPDYMIPSYFIPLDKMPLTPVGKIDRKALLEPDQFRPKLGMTYVAPKTDIETIIAENWKDILKLEKVGIYDNFFELGGNSLDIIKMVSRLKEVLGKEIEVITLFEYPTIDSLVNHLNMKKEEAEHVDKEIEKRELDESKGLLLETIELLGEE